MHLVPTPQRQISGICIPIGEHAWRDRYHAALVRWLLAHPEGCLIVVRLIARQNSGREKWEEVDNSLQGQITGAGPNLVDARIIRQDGTSFRSSSIWKLPSPGTSCLFDFQAEASGDDELVSLDLTYWLTPVPPESFSFELWSERLGAKGAVVLDGAQIVAAGTRAEPDWLD